MTRLTSPSDPQAPHARFTVEQFHRLCEAVPEQRLELIAGEVLTVLAKGTRHSVLVNRVTQLITLWLAARTDCPWELRVESPLCLGERDDPSQTWPWCGNAAMAISAPIQKPPTPCW
jgi:hypothetical protein